MVFHLSGKWLMILFLAAGLFSLLVHLGAQPSPQLSLLSVLISVALVFVFQRGWQKFNSRRHQGEPTQEQIFFKD